MAGLAVSARLATLGHDVVVCEQAPTWGGKLGTFERDGFYRVGCDIHPAMAASVFAASTPFTALAGPDGSFAFADVPAGAWTITAYADGKRLHKDVEVAAGVTNVTVE